MNLIQPSEVVGKSVLKVCQDGSAFAMYFTDRTVLCYDGTSFLKEGIQAEEKVRLMLDREINFTLEHRVLASAIDRDRKLKQLDSLLLEFYSITLDEWEKQHESK